jgi:hypothetical protein
MDIYREVLQIIARAPQPVGWYAIEHWLGMKGVVLDVPLPSVLHELVDQGYIRDETAPGSRGSYHLTPAGNAYLERKQQTAYS